MVDLVLFDLDGTLIDSAPTIMESVNNVMDDIGHDAFSLPEIVGFIGNGLPVLVERVMMARGLPADTFPEVHRRIRDRYAVLSLEEPHYYDGAVSALNALKEKGKSLAICTNKPVDLARAILERSATLSLFDVVLGGDSLPLKKPDPAPLFEARARLGGGAAVFVGDSEIDAEAAERASMPFFLHTRGYAKRPLDEMVAEARFEDFTTLPRLVDAL